MRAGGWFASCESALTTTGAGFTPLSAALSFAIQIRTPAIYCITSDSPRFVAVADCLRIGGIDEYRSGVRTAVLAVVDNGPVDGGGSPLGERVGGAGGGDEVTEFGNRVARGWREGGKRPLKKVGQSGPETSNSLFVVPVAPRPHHAPAAKPKRLNEPRQRIRGTRSMPDPLPSTTRCLDCC